MLGVEPRSVSGAFHIRLPTPVSTSATQIAHGEWLLVKIESGAPPPPRVLTNVSLLPSGDHLGERSLLNDGDIHVIGLSSLAYTPRSRWSSRFEMKASLSPSGDQFSSVVVPRALNKLLAAEDPSTEPPMPGCL